MALEVNPHVKRLRRFQPFQPDSAELVYEQSDPREKRYETVALGYLALLVEEPGVKMIVLTGDAGHGKTSLCAKLLERFGMDADTAAEAIRAQGDGAGPVTTSESGRPLWLLKDLSDITVDRAAALLARCWNYLIRRSPSFARTKVDSATRSQGTVAKESRPSPERWNKESETAASLTQRVPFRSSI